jgi:hypothetical protein
MTRTVHTERPATTEHESIEQPGRKRPTPSTDGGGEAPRRLVVELNKRPAQDLQWLVDSEELNKTTIVNRALQVYKHIVELQQRGGSVLLEDPTKDHPERMLIV